MSYEEKQEIKDFIVKIENMLKTKSADEVSEEIYKIAESLVKEQELAAQIELLNIDQWYQHEGLTLTSAIISMLEKELGYPEDSWDETFKHQVCHPSIWNERTNNLLKNAIDNLAELYQAIGEWEEDFDDSVNKGESE
jgi:hypothetical protein